MSQETCSIIFKVDLDIITLFNNFINNFTSFSNNFLDFLRVDLENMNLRSIFLNSFSWLSDSLKHKVHNLLISFTCSIYSLMDNLERKSLQFSIKLNSIDSFFSSSDLKIHISSKVLCSHKVIENTILSNGSIF